MRRVGVTELARKLGVNQPTVTAWFTKGAEAKATQIAAIPEALGISGHWLLTGEGSMEDSPEEAERLLGQIRRLLAAPSDRLRAAHRNAKRRGENLRAEGEK